MKKSILIWCILGYFGSPVYCNDIAICFPMGCMQIPHWPIIMKIFASHLIN